MRLEDFLCPFMLMSFCVRRMSKSFLLLLLPATRRSFFLFSQSGIHQKPSARSPTCLWNAVNSHPGAGYGGPISKSEIPPSFLQQPQKYSLLFSQSVHNYSSVMIQSLLRPSLLSSSNILLPVYSLLSFPLLLRMNFALFWCFKGCHESVNILWVIH